MSFEFLSTNSFLYIISGGLSQGTDNSMDAAQRNSELMGLGITYHHDNFQTLPTLHRALDLYGLNDAEDHLLGALQQLFLEKNMQHKYSLVLLYRHSDLKSTERLVWHNETATPWYMAGTSQSIAETPGLIAEMPACLADLSEPILPAEHGGYVCPSSFRAIRGQVVPYEFQYTTGIPNLDTPFLFDVMNLLKQLQLEDVFGVRRIKQGDRTAKLRVRNGRANIELPFQPGRAPSDQWAEVMWVFRPGDGPVTYLLCTDRTRRNNQQAMWFGGAKLRYWWTLFSDFWSHFCTY